MDILRYQNCFGLNFGWNQPITIPQVKLNLESNVSDFQNLETGAPSHCFLVLIGRQYEDSLPRVTELSKSLSAKLGTRPALYFLEMNEDQVSESFENSPAMVRNYSVVHVC